MSRYSIAQARDQLPQLVHDAEAGTPVELTRRGKLVAMLVSVDQYRRMASGQKSFWDALEEFRANVDLQAAGIDRKHWRNLRDKSPGREVNL